MYSSSSGVASISTSSSSSSSTVRSLTSACSSSTEAATTTWRTRRRRASEESFGLDRLREVAAQGENDLEQLQWSGTRNPSRWIERIAVDCAIAGESSDAMRRETGHWCSVVLFIFFFFFLFLKFSLLKLSDCVS